MESTFGGQGKGIETRKVKRSVCGRQVRMRNERKVMFALSRGKVKGNR